MEHRSAAAVRRRSGAAPFPRKGDLRAGPGSAPVIVWIWQNPTVTEGRGRMARAEMRIHGASGGLREGASQVALPISRRGMNQVVTTSMRWCIEEGRQQGSQGRNGATLMRWLKCSGVEARSGSRSRNERSVPLPAFRARPCRARHRRPWPPAPCRRPGAR